MTSWPYSALLVIVITGLLWWALAWLAYRADKRRRYGEWWERRQVLDGRKGWEE